MWTINPQHCLLITVPGGVRLGAHALTSRGFDQKNFVEVVDFIDEAVAIAKEVQNKSKKLKDFKEVLDSDSDINNKCDDLRARVNAFASKYSMPGHDDY